MEEASQSSNSVAVAVIVWSSSSKSSVELRMTLSSTRRNNCCCRPSRSRSLPVVVGIGRVYSFIVRIQVLLLYRIHDKTIILEFCDQRQFTGVNFFWWDLLVFANLPA